MISKIISKINKYSENYINKKKTEFKKQKDKLWDNKFLSSNKFVFNLNDKIKINLYKDSVLSRLIYEGFEQEELNYIEKTLAMGDIFIDVGSNIGLHSLIASFKVGENGNVIAFEPSPITFERFLENISLNNIKNIEVRNKGISNKSEFLNFNISEDGYDAWNTFAHSDESNMFSKEIEVEVNTLDNELENIDKSRIKIIKIDVEGWEKFVILGGKKILIEYSPIVMMEFTETNTFAAGYMVQELYDIMIAIGYEWFCYTNGKLISEKKRLHYPYNNLIAIKKLNK